MTDSIVQPFPDAKWHGFTARMTKAAREFTKRWKRDRSGFRVDGRAILIVGATLVMKGDGELVGWFNPTIRGLEPRSHDWMEELDLENLNDDILSELGS